MFKFFKRKKQPKLSLPEYRIRRIEQENGTVRFTAEYATGVNEGIGGWMAWMTWPGSSNCANLEQAKAAIEERRGWQVKSDTVVYTE